MRSALLLIASLLSQSAFAATTPPLYISTSFKPEIRARIQGDLKFMGSIISDGKNSALHQEVFGSMSGSNYLKWFKQRINKISSVSCGGNENAVACVMPLFMGPHEMGVTKNYINTTSPLVARVSILLHEARHTEPHLPDPKDPNAKDERYWLHAKCPIPFLNAQGEERTSIWTGAVLSGKDACDSTVYGSYGVAVIFLKNMSQHCKNCNEKTREDAELYGSDQLTRIITPEAIQKITEDQ